MKLILASGSKTRYDLLNSLHISFQVEPVELVEDVTATLPEEHCQEISRRKAERISKNHNDGLIIAAESKVFYGRDIPFNHHRSEFFTSTESCYSYFLYALRYCDLNQRRTI